MSIAVRAIDRLGRRVLLDGYSDRDLAVLLDTYIEPGMCYFDVGSHFGQYALMAAKRVGPAGHVHAFEPTSHTFLQLTRNVELNHLANVVLNNCALYNEETELEFHVCNSKGTSEFNSIGKTLRPDDAVVEIVRAETLDAYCLRRGVERIDFMKVDVEGAELSVLDGGSELFGADHAPPLCVEFHEMTCRTMGYGCELLRRRVLDFGYELYRLDMDRGTLVSEPEGVSYDEVVNLIAIKDTAVFKRRLGFA